MSGHILGTMGKKAHFSKGAIMKAMHAAVAKAMAELNKEYGENTVMRLGQGKIPTV